MRPTQKQNRPRGRGGRKPGGGGGGGGNNINRVYESNGPEGKVRGTPQQIVDKYLSLARDSQTSGDRVVAENFLQHAEHYQRILLEAAGARAEQRGSHPSEQDQPDIDDNQDDDGDDQPDTAPPAAAESRQPDGDNGQRRERRPRERPEVSGLTTIDADDNGGGSLLVDAEEVAPHRPRRRRRGPAEGEAPQGAAAEPASEVTSE